jgi:D-glycero-D-manno-heptose 1,7-bisphosphate phosphatase
MNTPAARIPYLDPAADALLATAPVPRRALFLDRDGVINLNHGYVHTSERTDWVPGIFDLVAAAHAEGFLSIVVTNQAGIGRGYYSEAQFLGYTAWLHREFAQRGARLLATYWCPHHPHAGQEPYKVACSCRKPQPGMLLAAAEDFALDLPASILVGDSRSDLEAARAAGVGEAHFLEPGLRLSADILRGLC